MTPDTWQSLLFGWPACLLQDGKRCFYQAETNRQNISKLTVWSKHWMQVTWEALGSHHLEGHCLRRSRRTASLQGSVQLSAETRYLFVQKSSTKPFSFNNNIQIVIIFKVKVFVFTLIKYSLWGILMMLTILITENTKQSWIALTDGEG